MYITVEEFTKHVSHYLQMAKANDVYIEDAMHMTVWVLRSQRTPLLSRLAGTRLGASCNRTRSTCATQGI